MTSLILTVLITLFLMLPVFTYLIFWYEAANSVYGPALYRESNGRPFPWLLRGVLSSISTNIVVMCLFPFGLGRRIMMPHGERKQSGPAVVLIHGLYHNPSAWVYFRWRLKAKGCGRIYTFGYGSWNRSFWDIYRELETWMKGIERDALGEDMVLVGHSLGGLLAKTYAGKRGGSGHSKIRRVITLGLPFRGTKMVVFSFGALAKSLGYQGALVRELAQYHPVTLLPCVAFYSPVDNMVLPAESAVPPKGWKKEQTAPLCHTAMLYHRPTFDRFWSYVKEVPGEDPLQQQPETKDQSLPP